MKGMHPGWYLVFIVGGMIVICVMEVIRLMGWEWLVCQVERIWRRKATGRPDDDDDDPRGDFGGLAS